MNTTTKTNFNFFSSEVIHQKILSVEASKKYHKQYSRSDIRIKKTLEKYSLLQLILTY